MIKLLKKITKYSRSHEFAWKVALLFTASFFASMWFDTLREGPAISLFWGAITTNTPVAVILFFFLVGLATGLFRFSFTKNRNSYRITADRAVSLDEELKASDFEQSEGQKSKGGDAIIENDP